MKGPGPANPQYPPDPTILHNSLYAHDRGWKRVPMPRGVAWALIAAEMHGAKFMVTSADRRDSMLQHFHLPRDWGQGYLYGHCPVDGNHCDPGFFPANPPAWTSHCLHADGNAFYGPRGSSIPWWKLGIDADDFDKVNDCRGLVAKLNSLGFKAALPYGAGGSEGHHFSFKYDPSGHARHLVRQFAARHPFAARRYWFS